MESSPRFVVVHRKDFRRLGVLDVLLGVVAGFVCRSTAIAVAADAELTLFALFATLAVAWLAMFLNAKRRADSVGPAWTDTSDPGAIHWLMTEDTISRLCVGSSSVTLLSPAMRWRLRETARGTWVACHSSIDHSGEWPDLEVAKGACEREHARLMESIVEMDTDEIPVYRERV